MDEQVRLRLHELLVTTFPGLNVYFRPKNDLTLVYPCIVYDIKRPDPTYSGNNPYVHSYIYDVKILSQYPGLRDVSAMLTIPGARGVNTYTYADIVHCSYIVHFQ
jgi:hypothetical protein